MGIRKNRVAKTRKPTHSKQRGVRKPKFMREAEFAAKTGTASIRAVQTLLETEKEMV